jgi:hypothetical protein
MASVLDLVAVPLEAVTMVSWVSSVIDDVDELSKSCTSCRASLRQLGGIARDGDFLPVP